MGTFNQLYITIGILATSLMGNGLGDKTVDDRLWWLLLMFALPILTCLVRLF